MSSALGFHGMFGCFVCDFVVLDVGNSTVTGMRALDGGARAQQQTPQCGHPVRRLPECHVFLSAASGCSSFSTHQYQGGFGRRAGGAEGGHSIRLQTTSQSHLCFFCLRSRCWVCLLHSQNASFSQHAMWRPGLEPAELKHPEVPRTEIDTASQEQGLDYRGILGKCRDAMKAGLLGNSEKATDCCKGWPAGEFWES